MYVLLLKVYFNCKKFINQNERFINQIGAFVNQNQPFINQTRLTAKLT